MKISILLPYKENFSPEYPGAVSIFLDSVIRKSEFKNNTIVYGNSDYKSVFKDINYKNINISEKILGLGSQTNKYIDQFIKLENKKPSNIIEIHNRPLYVSLLPHSISKLVLYFHNDPLSMNGSKSLNERMYLLDRCSKIIFNSEWSKKRFLTNVESVYYKSQKLKVIHQSTNKQKIDFKKKEKTITFVGKLNKAKGYDVFGEAVVQILNKHKKWKAIVIGDEEREKINFYHKNIKMLGFQKHTNVINNFKKTSIAVVCSRWEEPFGRTSLEAASCGCAVVITNRGGLPETITNGIIINELNTKNVFKAIDQLISKNEIRIKLQKLSYNNFYLTNFNAAKQIDVYRKEILNNKEKNKVSIQKLKILHITNFNERHNGRLFYNTGRRINNGFIRLGHSVLEFSDRDIVSYYRSIKDFDGSKKLNSKLIEVISNYLPDLIVLGHADLIKYNTIKFIKKNYPNIKIAQWFLDRMDSEWISNLERFKDKMNLMDGNFCTTDPSILKVNNKKKIYFIPNPVDASFELLNNSKKNNFNNDIFFAMSHGVHRGVLKKGKYDKREIIIAKLQKMAPNIKFDLYGMKKNQPIWADDFLNAISKSKIGLNLSQGKPIKYYSSDRFAQLVGNGLCVMVDKKTKLNDFFSEKEIVFYKSIKDLAKKVLYYTNNNKQRKLVAAAGRKKYFKHFNSTNVADFIINKTFNTKKKFYWDKK
jgi:glycosyltransferase involved in cell wall biosynthesis